MTRPASTIRTVSNVLVLVLLVLGAGLAWDMVSVWAGNPPMLSCTVGPLLAWAARITGMLLFAIGVIVLLATRRSRGHVLLFLLGTIVFWLPDLMGQFIAPRC